MATAGALVGAQLVGCQTVHDMAFGGPVASGLQGVGARVGHRSEGSYDRKKLKVL